MSADNDNPQRQPIQLDYAPDRAKLPPWFSRGNMIMMTLAALLFLFFVVHVFQCAPTSRRLDPQAVCSSNLHQIAMVLVNYSHVHEAMPTTLSDPTFIQEATLWSRNLSCPTTQIPYVYLPTSRFFYDSDLIYAYEPVGIHDKNHANAVFGDGYVEPCTQVELQEHLKMRDEILELLKPMPDDESLQSAHAEGGDE